MGITGELVRSVFSKSRSIKTHDNNMKINAVEKKRWKTSVKSYLCGDELFDSVLAEEDSASVKSSEATVMQILPEHGYSTEDIQSQYTLKHETSDRDNNSFSFKSFDEDAAATIIQSAFRGFKVRCLRRETAGFQNDFGEGMKSPSRESLATSIEVQTGNSTGVDKVQEEDPSCSTKLQNKTKPSAYKPKEDWDDSTVDSTISKMRIQNRLEAMTRRERALAYAFSQQLRICSKKKHTKSDGTEPNMGWSWLERWMATRQIEGSSVEDCSSKQLINIEAAYTMKTRPFPRKKFLDLSFEEKESCGSNEVPVQVDSSPNPEREDKHGCQSSRSRLKAPRSISRRKTVPTHHYQKEHSKASKEDGSKEAAKDRRQKTKQAGSSSVCNDEASWSPVDHSVSGQNSRSDP